MIDQIITAQKDAQQRHVLNVWVLYDHPKDYPTMFVARRYEIGSGKFEPMPTNDVISDAKLHVLRACFRCAGLIPFLRKESDDPVIMETWL